MASCKVCTNFKERDKGVLNGSCKNYRVSGRYTTVAYGRVCDGFLPNGEEGGAKV